MQVGIFVYLYRSFSFLSKVWDTLCDALMSRSSDLRPVPHMILVEGSSTLILPISLSLDTGNWVFF